MAVSGNAKNMIRDVVEANALITDLREKNRKEFGEQILPQTNTVGHRRTSVPGMTVSVAPEPNLNVPPAPRSESYHDCLSDNEKLSWELDLEEVQAIRARMNPHFTHMPEDFFPF